MTLEELVVVLGLEVKDDGLQQFKSNLQGVASKFALVTGGAIAAAAAIAAVAGAVVHAAVESAKEISNQAKLARNIGITSQALHRMEYAAQQVGLPAGHLTGVLAGLRDQLDKVPFGESNLESLLNVMGLSPYDPRGKLKSLHQILLDVMGVIEAAPESLKEARLGQASEIFPGMRAFLQLGPGGLQQLEAEARPASEALVADAEEIIRKWNKVKEIFQSFGRENLLKPTLDALLGLANVVERIAKSEYFDKFSEQMGKVSKSFGQFYKEQTDALIPRMEKTQQLAENIVKKMFGVKELSGGQAAIAMLMTGAIAMNPNGPASAEDVQNYLDGKAGTRTASELQFFSQLAEDIMSWRPNALASFAGSMAGSLATPPGAAAPAPIVVNLNNDNHFAAGTDVPGALRSLDQSNAEAVKKALGTSNKRQRK